MTAPTTHRATRWITAGVCALVLAGCGSDDGAPVEDQEATADATADGPDAPAEPTGEPETPAVPDAADEPDTPAELEPEPADEPETPAEPAAGTEVLLRDDDGFVFEPVELSVAAGDTVTWVHDGRISHTVTADDDSFESGTLAAGDTFEVTFDEPGSYPYACDFHSSMRGTVTVS
ncbi:MAG: plastocyanin/azurin family copper-binding protein [Nitriliruptor sp.]